MVPIAEYVQRPTRELIDGAIQEIEDMSRSSRMTWTRACLHYAVSKLTSTKVWPIHESTVYDLYSARDAIDRTEYRVRMEFFSVWPPSREYIVTNLKRASELVDQVKTSVMLDTQSMEHYYKTSRRHYIYKGSSL